MSYTHEGNIPTISYEDQVANLERRQAEDATIMREWGLLDRMLKRVAEGFEEITAEAQSSGNIPDGIRNNEPLALRKGTRFNPAITRIRDNDDDILAVRLDVEAEVEVDGFPQIHPEVRLIHVSENGEPAVGFTDEDALIINALAARIRAEAKPDGLWPDLADNLSDIKRMQPAHRASGRRVPRIGEQAS